MRNKLILITVIMAFSLAGCSKKDDSTDVAAAAMDANTSAVQAQDQATAAPSAFNSDGTPVTSINDTAAVSAQADQNSTANLSNSSDLTASPAPGALQDVNGSAVVGGNETPVVSSENNTTSVSSNNTLNQVSNNSTATVAPISNNSINVAGALSSNTVVSSGVNSTLKIKTAMKSRLSDESTDDQDQSAVGSLGGDDSASSTNDNLSPVDAD